MSETNVEIITAPGSLLEFLNDRASRINESILNSADDRNRSIHKKQLNQTAIDQLKFGNTGPALQILRSDISTMERFIKAARAANDPDQKNIADDIFPGLVSFQMLEADATGVKPTFYGVK